MKVIHSLFFLVLTFSFFSSCKSDSSKSETSNIDYLYTDFKPDELYPARQVELQIKSAGSTMYMVLPIQRMGKGHTQPSYFFIVCRAMNEI